jgi:hypothetical protein
MEQHSCKSKVEAHGAKQQIATKRIVPLRASLEKGIAATVGSTRFLEVLLPGINCIWVKRVSGHICGFTMTTGSYLIDNTKCLLIQKDFPTRPTLEYWVVDLLNNYDYTNLDRNTAVTYIKRYIETGVLQKSVLFQATLKYGSSETGSLLSECFSSEWLAVWVIILIILKVAVFFLLKKTTSVYIYNEESAMKPLVTLDRPLANLH